MTSFWQLILLFIGLFFIFSICKKYTNTNDKDQKHANAIDISIIWSCGAATGRVGGGVSSAGSFIACIGSFIACIGSISATFLFASFRILSFNLFMYFSLLCMLPQDYLGLLLLFLIFCPCFILSKRGKD